MRKILSLMMALVLTCTFANAETVRLYCKVTQSWWKADGAAVAIFAWTDGGTNNANWPGVRMTAVEGEADMWYGDVDPAVHNKLIFVRVNGSGDIADWGAKTADLTFPTDGKNLYTITSETAVWGNPGVTGEWSVKGEAQGGDDPEPETGCNWDNLEWLGDGAGGGKYSNMFKVCLPEGWGVVNIQSPGFATKPGIYVTVPAGISACSLGEGNYDVQGAGIILHVDAFTQEETEVSIIHGTGEGTLTVYRKPSYYVVGNAQALGAWTPANGVKVFGDSVNFTLAAGTYKLKVVNGPSWEGTTALGYNALKEGQTGLSTDNDNNIVFTLAAEGAVAIKVENNKVIVDLPASQGGDDPEPQPTIHYYLVGSMQGWSLENAIPMPGDSLVIEDVAAGTYALKILPQNTGWDNALTFANVNADCSSAGISEGDQGNIVATVEQNGPVKIKVVNGQICITGNFVVPVTANYYLVGTMTTPTWNLEAALPMVGDSIVLTLAANAYEFKVLPQNTSWANALGASAVNAECSSEGVESSDTNVKIILAAESEVKIKVVNGQLCVTGSFGGQVAITSYTVVGDAGLMGSGWNTNDANNEMTLDNGVWKLEKKNVEIAAGQYWYKVVGNHSYSVFEYPGANQSQDYVFNVAGTYNLTFTFTPGDQPSLELSALNVASNLRTIDSESNIEKFIENGQLYIRANGQVYTIMGVVR